MNKERISKVLNMKVKGTSQKGDTDQDRNCRLGKMSQRGRMNMGRK
jgi:hypothetical protein